MPRTFNHKSKSNKIAPEPTDDGSLGVSRATKAESRKSKYKQTNLANPSPSPLFMDAEALASHLELPDLVLPHAGRINLRQYTASSANNNAATDEVNIENVGLSTINYEHRKAEFVEIIRLLTQLQSFLESLPVKDQLLSLALNNNVDTLKDMKSNFHESLQDEPFCQFMNAKLQKIADQYQKIFTRANASVKQISAGCLPQLFSKNKLQTNLLLVKIARCFVGVFEEPPDESKDLSNPVLQLAGDSRKSISAQALLDIKMSLRYFLEELNQSNTHENKIFRK